MAKTLRCRDPGFDCDGVVQAATNEEVLQQAKTHAREVHGLDEIPNEVVQKAVAPIRDENSTPASM